MTEIVNQLVGPRVAGEDFRRHRARYLLPTLLLFAAAVLVGTSYFLPFWRMRLEAPQYPNGLHVVAYLNRLQGDVSEIDGLNHYIGMRPLNDAAQLERSTSGMLIGALVLLVAAGSWIHSRWAAVLAAPALLFPVGFLLDLQFWLAAFGTNLDPHAALSNSIKPFVPPVLGTGVIGQFKTVASPGSGFWVAVAASLVIAAALYFHRRAYKPLFDAARNAARSDRSCASNEVEHVHA